MNTLLHPIGTVALARGIAVVLFVLHAIVQAQDAPPPAPAPADAPAQTEMQKWIATTDAQWQAAHQRDVTEVHESELNKVKLQYLTMLEDAIRKASGASDLDGAVALRNEQKRFADASLLPGANPFPAQVNAADAASVKQLRVAIRTPLAKLEKDDSTRAKALHAKYDQVLAQAQGQLTQRQRFDDALLVKAKRDEVSAAWLTPGLAAVAEAPAPAVPPTASETPKPAAPVAKVPFGTKAAPKPAKVEAQDTVLAPLNAGEQLLSDALKVQWVDIPDFFQGFQFTKVKEYVPTLRFKVLSDGLLYMACTNRFGGGGNAGGNWKNEIITEEQLHKKGWHRERRLELKATDAALVWWVYSRTCKAGEEFTYRTEKYKSPILLVK